jgi:hypothetical protein
MNDRKRFLVEPGAKVRLAKIDPSDTGKQESHEQALAETQRHVARMDALQYSRPWTPPARTAWCGTCSAA